MFSLLIIERILIYIIIFSFVFEILSRILKITLTRNKRKWKNLVIYKF